MKVSDLEGPMLDYWVARATTTKMGDVFKTVDGRVFRRFNAELLAEFYPSTDWSHGGLLIEEHGIELWKWSGSDGTYWCSHAGPRQLGAAHYIGPTPLIAAMRALVASKFGAEVGDD